MTRPGQGISNQTAIIATIPGKTASGKPMTGAVTSYNKCVVWEAFEPDMRRWCKASAQLEAAKGSSDPGVPEADETDVAIGSSGLGTDETSVAIGT